MSLLEILNHYLKHQEDVVTRRTKYELNKAEERAHILEGLLIALDKTWDDDLLPLCSQIFRRDIRASSELTQAEAVKALGFLKQKATEQKVAA